MKRLFTIGLMLASAFALTNCAEEIAAPVQDDVTVDGNIENTTPPEEEVNIPFDVFANFAESADTKTYTLGNHTYWDSGDQISVFHKPQGADNYNLNNAFTLADVRTGQFSGSLTKALGQTNDWYFIYPSIGTGLSSVTTNTLTINKVKIGAEVQTQVGANNKEHLDGDVTPMYGMYTNLVWNENPRIEMTHLAAVVAIKIVNVGSGGDIIVKNIEVSAGSEKIVGEFDVNIPNNPNEDVSYTFKDKYANFTSAKLQVEGDGILIPRYVENKDGFATVYLAVKPFKANAGTKLTVKINSSVRTIELSESINIEAGKVTTFRVPVSTMTRSTDTNILTMTGGDDWFSDPYYLVSLGTENVDYTKREMCINGKSVEAYELGSQSCTSKVVIYGTPKDLIGKAPVSFYASSWNNTHGVMRLNRIYTTLLGKDIDFSYEQLITMMDPKKIQFDGLVPLEQQTASDGTTYLTILDENVVHKDVSIDAINELLANFDDDPDDGKTPTYAGLKKAIESPTKIYTDSEAKTTANILLEKVQRVLQSSAYGEQYGWLIDYLDDTPMTIFTALGNTKVTVELTTVPSGELGATDSRILVWGLHSGQ